MSFTAESNRKMVERLIAEKGVDADGKSLHHKRARALSKGNPTPYFKKLAETPEGREKLKQISQKGARQTIVNKKKKLPFWQQPALETD